MSKKCSLKTKEELKIKEQLRKDALSEHIGKINDYPVFCILQNTKILMPEPQTLQDLCILHYIGRYRKHDKAELTKLPNWQFLCRGKYRKELCFMMLLCKENVGCWCE